MCVWGGVGGGGGGGGKWDFTTHFCLPSRVVLAVGDFNCSPQAIDSAYLMDDPVRLGAGRGRGGGRTCKFNTARPVLVTTCIQRPLLFKEHILS